MATPNKPIRKPANINVSPVGNQGNKGQTGILPSHRTATPFGSVDKSEYKRPSAPSGPMQQPVNDKDAGRGTGNLRSAKNTRHMGFPKNGGD